MPQRNNEQGTEVMGFVEIIEESGKINAAVFEFPLPSAELIIPVLPTRFQPPGDLSRTVKTAMSRAGDLWNFYLLTYQNVLQFRTNLTKMYISVELEAEVTEIESRLEEIELFMRDVLIKKGTPRLIFWITSKVYFETIPDVNPWNLCSRLS